MLCAASRHLTFARADILRHPAEHILCYVRSSAEAHYDGYPEGMAWLIDVN